MEEVIAKTKRGLYIATYMIYFVVGILFLVFGIFCAVSLGAVEEEAAIVGWCIFGVGVFLIIASICWLIHFIRMPKAAIAFKDGKLRFMNGVECTPLEVESWQVKSGGVDGALFNFGRLNVVVNGKQIKLKYIENVNYVTSRLYTLKAECEMQSAIAKRNAEEDKTEE